MRKIREVLRLTHELGLSVRDVRKATGVGKTAVCEYVNRAKVIGITWPIAPEIDDAELERLLFTPAGFHEGPTKSLPDWAKVHEELKRRGVTLMILWEEHRAEYADGHGYSRFCALYGEWRKRLAPTMRQTHVAGDKLFVDWAGDTVPIVVPSIAFAANYPAPKQGEWIARDFMFHTGEVLPEVKLHYTTIGEATGAPVVALHGTSQSAAAMLFPPFADELFGPCQPLDATKYYIIIPDALGHGRSSKPSDGLKAKFPQYDYVDMVDAQYRLLSEGLGIRNVRLIIGNSMGGMLAWVWGERYPGYMDALVPMASQPTAMASRNWMLRRMMLETIRNDPDYNNGNYTIQPRALKYASIFYGIATAGGTLNYQKEAPTRELADKIVDARLAAPIAADANDFLWAWGSSSDYDPAPGLEKIKAWVLAINAADDERNPPETGITVEAMKRVKNGKLYLIPASDQTSGHATTAYARFYKQELQEFLQMVPR